MILTSFAQQCHLIFEPPTADSFFQTGRTKEHTAVVATGILFPQLRDDFPIVSQHLLASRAEHLLSATVDALVHLLFCDAVDVAIFLLLVISPAPTCTVEREVNGVKLLINGVDHVEIVHESGTEPEEGVELILFKKKTWK